MKVKYDDTEEYLAALEIFLMEVSREPGGPACKILNEKPPQRELRGLVLAWWRDNYPRYARDFLPKELHALTPKLSAWERQQIARRT